MDLSGGGPIEAEDRLRGHVYGIEGFGFAASSLHGVFRGYSRFIVLNTGLIGFSSLGRIGFF